MLTVMTGSVIGSPDNLKIKESLFRNLFGHLVGEFILKHPYHFKIELFIKFLPIHSVRKTFIHFTIT